MNPPRYIKSSISKKDKLEELEFSILSKYDKNLQKLGNLVTREKKLKEQLKSLKKLPRTKTKQKEVNEKLKDILTSRKKIIKDQRSLSGKLKTVHKYMTLLDTGDFKTEHGDKTYTRKSDEAKIIERSQHRRFSAPLELSNNVKKNVIGQTILMASKDLSRFPKQKDVQKRVLIKLTVDGTKGYDPRKREKDEGLRKEWFNREIEKLQKQKKKTDKKRVKYINARIAKLRKDKKERKISEECKKFIQKNYMRIANTDGETYISTPYVYHGGREFNNLIKEQVDNVLSSFMASYRLKEESIHINSIGVIERITK